MSNALCIKKEQIYSPIEEWKPFLVDRSLCETDEKLLQIIPYAVLIDSESNDVFSYTRGKAGNEVRLHSKISIGIGGHIEDVFDGSIFELIANNLSREIKEETDCYCSVGDIVDNLENGFYDIIYNPESDDLVDRVHVGIVLYINVLKNQLAKFEEDVIHEPKWLSLKQLSTLFHMKNNSLEYWSYLASGEILKNEKIEKEMKMYEMQYVEINTYTNNHLKPISIKIVIDITDKTLASQVEDWQKGNATLCGYSEHPNSINIEYKEMFISPGMGINSSVIAGDTFKVELKDIE